MYSKSNAEHFRVDAPIRMMSFSFLYFSIFTIALFLYSCVSFSKKKKDMLHVSGICFSIWLEDSRVIAGLNEIARLVHNSVPRRTMKRAVALTKKRGKRSCRNISREIGVALTAPRTVSRCVDKIKLRSLSSFYLLFDGARSFYSEALKMHPASVARVAPPPPLPTDTITWREKGGERERAGSIGKRSRRHLKTATSTDKGKTWMHTGGLW